MKRQIYRKLQAWKQKKTRKPLILMGVRQCGKTYCLEQFGKEAFKRVHHINFEQQKEHLHNVFTKDLDPLRIVNELSFYLDTTINTATDLLIFDEIQACPNAITSLKYFHEKMPELALASAGSLLGLHLNPSSFPVGKIDLLHLYPLSFQEFLWAIGDNKTADFIARYQSGETIAEVIHTHAWERLKHYFITGGLPEVVDTFRKESNLYEAFKKVREKQKELLFAYYSDIAKHAGKTNALHIDRVWRSSASQLAQTQDGSSKRFQFKNIVPGIGRYDRLASAIDWLVAAELVIQVPIVKHAALPLTAFTELNKFKLYLFDIGILGAMSELPPKSILDYDYGTYKGYFAESFIAQAFNSFRDETLYSWQEKRTEVEFLMVNDGDIIPVEVKSGWVTKAQSLTTYANKYHPPYKIVFSARNAYFNEEIKLRAYPLYLANITMDLDT